MIESIVIYYSFTQEETSKIFDAAEESIIDRFVLTNKIDSGIEIDGQITGTREQSILVRIIHKSDANWLRANIYLMYDIGFCSSFASRLPLKQQRWINLQSLIYLTN